MTASKEQMIALIKVVSSIDNANLLELDLTSDRLVISSMSTSENIYYRERRSVTSLNGEVKNFLYWKDYVPRNMESIFWTKYNIKIDGGLKPSIILDTFLEKTEDIEEMGELTNKRGFLREKKIIKYKATYASVKVTHKIVNGETFYILTEQEAKDLYNYVEEAKKRIKINAENINTFNRLKNYNIISAKEIAE